MLFYFVCFKFSIKRSFKNFRMLIRKYLVFWKGQIKFLAHVRSLGKHRVSTHRVRDTVLEMATGNVKLYETCLPHTKGSEGMCPYM